METYEAASDAPYLQSCVPVHTLAGVKGEHQTQAGPQGGVEEISPQVPHAGGLLQHLRGHHPAVASCPADNSRTIC